MAVNGTVCVVVLAVSAFVLLTYGDHLDATLLTQVVVQFLLAFGTLVLIFKLAGRGQQQGQRSDPGQSSTSTSSAEVASTSDQGAASGAEQSGQETAANSTAAKLQQNRERLQDQYTSQATDYAERVLQPKLEAKRQKKEEDFMRFMGAAWKGQRHTLGSSQDDWKPGRVGPGHDGSSREAAGVRQLSHEALNPPAPPPTPPTKTKRVISLPEEPAEGAVGSVTVAFRTPISRVLRRRFLRTDTIQLLLDYVTTCGFSQGTYSICTSYPRECISLQPDQTLQDAGITSDTTLYLED